MMFRVLAVAGLLLSTVAPGQAQDLRGPRELPPAGFKGQQYVDSRGCVFLRGGISGRVTWVPRVSGTRRQLCGFPPSFTPAPDIEVAVAPVAPPAPAVAPRRAGDPIDTVASTTAAPTIRDTTRRTSIPAARYAPPPVAPAAAPVRTVAAPAPVAPAAPQRPAPAAADIRVAAATPGCPAHAPFGERFLTTDGRSALLCVADPQAMPAFAQRLGMTQGRVMAAAPVPRPAPDMVARAAQAPVSLDPVPPVVATGPRYLADGRIACPAEAPVARRFPLRDGGTTLLCTTAAGGIDGAVAGLGATGRATAPIDPPKVPKGYRAAWSDDRLNPRRGQGTAEGQIAQDRVWTREVPARLVADVPKAQRRVAVSTANAPASAPRRPAAALSTSAAPTPAAPPAKARIYVQVGSFGQPANAEGARGRLARLGLPVTMGRGSIKGKPVQVVHAGPFATVEQARAALGAARGAGFSDAFIR